MERRAREVVHQPQAPNRPRAQDGVVGSRNVACQEWPKRSDDEVDTAILNRLDMAVVQLIEDGKASGGIPRPTDEDVSRLPRVVALGPPTLPAVSVVTGRLPQQLADLRLHLRALGSYCDSLQSTAAAAREKGAAADEVTAIDSMEAAHASAMEQARQLLQEHGAQDSPGVSRIDLGSPAGGAAQVTAS